MPPYHSLGNNTLNSAMENSITANWANPANLSCPGNVFPSFQEEERRNEALVGGKEFKIVPCCGGQVVLISLCRFMAKSSKNRTKTLRLRCHMGLGRTCLAILGQSGADKGQVSECPDTTDNKRELNTCQQLSSDDN